MGKPKRKTAFAVVARKKKKRVDSDEPKNNPFEVRVNRKKHDVLGQRIRSGRGLPGVARSRAVQKRKKTLLLEYRSRHKTGKFIDQRFGEYNENLTVEERVARRFLLEKKKRHKRSGMFNLEDGDEDGLTHFGQSLGDLEKYDDVQLSGGDEEEEDIGETHFGGFLRKKKTNLQQESDEPKSRKEIMNELVAKSKQMKYERQTEKQNTEELMDVLDSQWKDIRGLVTQSKSSTPSTSSAPMASSDYDRVVRELLYEKKAQATNRLKTEEESAREERERLVKMEVDRVRRMKGEVEGPSREESTLAEEGLEHTSADTISSKARKKKRVQFMLYYKDGVMVVPSEHSSSSGMVEKEVNREEGERGEEGEVEGGSGEEVEESDHGEGEGDSDDEGSGVEEMLETGESEGEEVEEGESDVDPAEEFGSDLESEGDSKLEEEEEEEEGEKDGGVDHCYTADSEKAKKLSELRKDAMKELPYTFKMPKSLQELLTITEGRSCEECVTVVERIHSCYHLSLSADNKQLLESFFGILVSYCCHLGKECTQDSLTTLNKMTSSLFSLAQLNSVHTARVFRKHLSSVYEMWKATRNRCFPPFEHVVLLRLVGVIFPTSDFKHPITIPAMMLMGQVLLKSSVKTLRDLVLGLLICEILTDFIAISKRFIPELVNFLSSCTALISTDAAVFYPPFTPHCKLRTKMCESISKLSSHVCLQSLPSILVMKQEGSEGEDPVISGSILSSCLQLLLKLCHLYRDLPSFPEIFSSVTFNLEHTQPTLPKKVKELVRSIQENVSAVSATPRPVLQLLKKKPKSIKFYEPSYDETYDIRKRRTTSKSVNERRKLRYKVKMERKGAIRELRKDSHFLSREKLRESRERDAERERKTRQIVHDLQSIQHEVKMEKLSRHKK